MAADDTVGLWDLDTRKPVWRLDEAGIYKQAHMTEDGGLVAFVANTHGPANKPHVVRLVSGRSGALIREISVKSRELSQVRLIRKGAQLLVAGIKGIFRYRVNPPLLLQTISVANPSGFDYHAAKDLLAVVDHDEVLRVVRAADGRVLHRSNLRQGGYGKYSPVFTPDGRFLATGGRSNTLWDAQTGMRLYHFGGRLTTGLRFLKGRSRILVTGNDGTIRMPLLPTFASSGSAQKVKLPLVPREAAAERQLRKAGLLRRHAHSRAAHRGRLRPTAPPGQGGSCPRGRQGDPLPPSGKPLLHSGGHSLRPQPLREGPKQRVRARAPSQLAHPGAAALTAT